VDDTRTRDSRSGPPRPELPQSLAWLYDPPPEELAPEDGAVEPAEDSEPDAADDPEALPTLLPFATPAEEPAPDTYGGPVRGLRSAFARFEEARMEAAPAFEAPDAGEPPSGRRSMTSTRWDAPVVRPFVPPVADGDAEPPDEPHNALPDEPDDEPRDESGPDVVASRAETPASLFEPVAIDVPAEPPADPRPMPIWNIRPSNSADEDEPDDAPSPASDAVSDPVPVAVDEGPDDPPAPPAPPAPPEPAPAPVVRPRLAGLLSRPAPPEPPEPEVPSAPPAPPVPPRPQPDDAAAEQDVEVRPVAEPAPQPLVPEPEPGPLVAERVVGPPRPDLADPALAPVWVAVRTALSGSARHATPALDVRGLDHAGRRALAGLLGVRTVRAATRVDLTELERVVQEIAGLPLTLAAERYLPVTGRRGRVQSRTAPVRAGQEWLDAHPELAAMSWTATWLETVRRDLVGGDTGLTETEVVAALEVLGALTAPGAADGRPWRVRQELAADVAGDEHALDEGAAVAGLVLRGLAASVGGLVPADAVARRRLWARFGVLADLVSTTCLAVGVAPADDEPGSRWRRAAEDGVPVHLTARDLRRAANAWVPIPHAWPAVLVVASPRVLDAVANRFAGRVAVVCTDGTPGPLPLDLLARLRAAGTDLRFLTDFDQTGLALGTQLAERFGATPWRMTAQVYRRSVRSDMPPLGARLPEVPWAPELPAAMTQAGRSVPVEQLLDEVLADLGAELTESGSDA
jgi:uncharacterized protein (TIGR02679 family)